MVWQESEAAQRFDEFFEAAVQQRPQTVSRRGIEVAVLVSFKEWNALKAKSHNPEQETDSREKH
jgi:prevent-host-death family protein